MLYALVDLNNIVDRIEGNIDPNVSTKTGWRWLKLIEIERPPYNPDIQIAEGPVLQVFEDHVDRYWTIRDKTIFEIQAEKIQNINNIDKIILFCLHDLENKYRNIKGQPNITLDEYKQYLISIL